MPLALQTYPTLAEAGSALKDAGARYLGGGTLVVRAANEGDVSLSTFVRSTDPALSAIKVEGGKATHRRFRDDGGRSPATPAWPRSPRRRKAVGGPAIRNMATVGGNLFAPAPYGDFAVALLALDATVQHRRSGEFGIDDFLAGRDGKHVGAIVAAVSFNVAARPRTFRFAESVARQAEGRLGAAASRPSSNGDGRQGDRAHASRSAAWPTGRSAPRPPRRRSSAQR